MSHREENSEVRLWPVTVEVPTGPVVVGTCHCDYCQTRTGSVVQVGGSEALVITVDAWKRLEEASGRENDLEHLDRYREELQ